MPSFRNLFSKCSEMKKSHFMGYQTLSSDLLYQCLVSCPLRCRLCFGCFHAKLFLKTPGGPGDYFFSKTCEEALITFIWSSQEWLLSCQPLSLWDKNKQMTFQSCGLHRAWITTIKVCGVILFASLLKRKKNTSLAESNTCHTRLLLMSCRSPVFSDTHRCFWSLSVILWLDNPDQLWNCAFLPDSIPHICPQRTSQTIFSQFLPPSDHLIINACFCRCLMSTSHTYNVSHKLHHFLCLFSKEFHKTVWRYHVFQFFLFTPNNYTRYPWWPQQREEVNV